MRYSASEKYEILQLVEQSSLSVGQTLKRLAIHRSTYYNWLKHYHDGGVDALEDKRPHPVAVWNRLPDRHRDAIVALALDVPTLSPRELAVRYTDEHRYFVSESTVYRLLKAQDLITSPACILIQASDRFQHSSRRVNELWQTDFTYFKVVGWGWYYLSTVMDDYSRFILAWRLCTGMKADDVMDTLNEALDFTGLDEVKVKHTPRLLSDNGPCYLSGDLADYPAANGLTHSRGKPYHPQIQGKIERRHRSMKNQILLNNYYFPSKLQEHIQRFVAYYNHERYHESLDNLTPADVYYGRGQQIREEGELIKLNTMAQRRQL